MGLFDVGILSRTRANFTGIFVGKRGFRDYNLGSMNSSISIQTEKPLADLNSFGIAALASRFVSIQTLAELDALRLNLKENASHEPTPVFVLGGGSNVIFPARIEALVLEMAIKGRALRAETESSFFVEAGAGENWHEFVLWTLANAYPGLENLSLIPGTVGAAPIQNIGAYGVEMQDFFHELTAYDLRSGELVRLNKAQCAFSYRDSIFKQAYREHMLVVQVCFALPKAWVAKLSYGDLARRVAENLGQDKIVRPSDVSEAVIQIRQSKLPDPSIIGNAGSFFKNPIVDEAQLKAILSRYPNCVHHTQSDARFKLAAGWLIEQCGWKGRSLGRVGVYEKQALVLVNLGGASGAEVRALAEAIVLDVQTRFGVRLEVEPVFA